MVKVGGGSGSSPPLVLPISRCNVLGQHAAFKPETAFNLRRGEAEPFWIVGFHNCQAASAPPLPPENRESWEFNYDGILALDPAGLRRRLMGEPSFRAKRRPVFTAYAGALRHVQFTLHQKHFQLLVL